MYQNKALCLSDRKRQPYAYSREDNQKILLRLKGLRGECVV